LNLDSIGIIGAGSFGIAIANLVAENNYSVQLLIRTPEQFENMQDKLKNILHPSISLVHQPQAFMDSCQLIFPIVPGKDLENAILRIKPYATSSHSYVHGTKSVRIHDSLQHAVETMSQMMGRLLQTSSLACLAGPNLAYEINAGLPAATVIASADRGLQERVGEVLRNKRFQVLYNDDMYGIELCGAIKNIMAIAAGAASALEVGDNAKALLINRGLIEMIHIGTHLGASVKSFYGVAGMGDLLATCYSSRSRNFSLGYRLAKGESFEEITQSMEETAEGITTTMAIHQLSEKNNWKTPITKMVFKALFESYPVADAIQHLMKLPVREDIDF